MSALLEPVLAFMPSLVLRGSFAFASLYLLALVFRPAANALRMARLWLYAIAFLICCRDKKYRLPRADPTVILSPSFTGPCCCVVMFAILVCVLDVHVRRCP
eukprot:TRINITY_DN6051_c0_g1_i1.p2 TRINITY_DN6051_c0_g1~~TRINITY_DN6051_c0_g1_i1.p2  ORF type:complete len:102 (+),score=11.29 TRINITY_DN6051_c0_g1_i1:130-435(+)